MSSFQIPWKCLDLEETPTIVAKSQQKAYKTFAQVLSNVCEIPTSQLPQPCVKGDDLAIMIPENDYSANVEACKLNLHGRVIWPKGATPLTVVALKNKLATYWKDLSKWGVSSLGRGYYEFVFSTLEDVNRVRSVNSWSMNPGLLKLFAWSKDFSPKTQRNSNAQVWVRLYGLSQEYWSKNILFTIAGSLGSPICTDVNTAKPRIERTFAQYARVLIDMDISQTIRYKLLVERKGFAFFIDVDYENIPDYCSNCKAIGHYVEICKKLMHNDEVVQQQEMPARNKQQSKPDQVYVQRNDNRRNQGKQVPVIDLEGNDEQKELSPDAELEREVNEALTREETNENIAENIQNQLDQNEQPVIHRNRFDALEVNDEVESQAEQPNLEDNQMDDESVQSSQDSEFVDATQMNNKTDDENLEEQQETSEVRNLKNAEFLAASWANIAEEAAAEALLLKGMENEVTIAPNQENPPFKLVTHRKKTQNKAITSKSNYKTRSKVYNHKPSK